MQIHNNYTISNSKKTFKIYNSVVQNFFASYNPQNNLLEYFYFFYLDNAVEKFIKIKAVFDDEKQLNKLSLKCTISILEANKNFIAAGIGSNLECISKANIAGGLIITETTSVFCELFFEINFNGKILSNNFYKVLMGAEKNVYGCNILKEDYILENYKKNATRASLKYDNGFEILYETDLKSRYALIKNLKEPLAVIILDFYTEEVVTKSLERGYYLEVNRKENDFLADTDKIVFYNKIADRVLGESNLNVTLTEQDVIKSSYFGDLFTVERGNDILIYRLVDYNANLVEYGGGKISKANIIYYDLGKNTLCYLSSGRATIINFDNETKETLNFDLTSAEFVKISDDAKILFVSNLNNTYNIYFLDSGEVMSGSNSLARYNYDKYANILYEITNTEISMYTIDILNKTKKLISIMNNVEYDKIVFDPTKVKNFLCFKNYIANQKIAELLVKNIFTRFNALFTSFPGKEPAISESGNYVFSNCSCSLYYFDKKYFGVRIIYTFTKAKYIFIGEKLVKLSNKNVIYKLDNSLKEVFVCDDKANSIKLNMCKEKNCKVKVKLNIGNLNV